MSFIRRGYPKPAKKTKHECPLPKWRWLPFLVWPRWREGARWRCDLGPLSPGCNQLWEYQRIAGDAGTCFAQSDTWGWRKISTDYDPATGRPIR